MTEEYDYDLVVVGGGPAGSSTAFTAAKSGIKVALLEKENSIAETVRTSGVTWIESIKELSKIKMKGTLCHTDGTEPGQEVMEMAPEITVSLRKCVVT